MVEHQAPFHCRIGERDALLQVYAGSGVFTQEEQSLPERVMGLQAGCRCGLALRQPIELFPEFPRLPQRSSALIEPAQAPQRRKELRRLANLVT